MLTLQALAGVLQSCIHPLRMSHTTPLALCRVRRLAFVLHMLSIKVSLLSSTCTKEEKNYVGDHFAFSPLPALNELADWQEFIAVAEGSS